MSVRRTLVAVLLVAAVGAVPGPVLADPMEVTGHPCSWVGLSPGDTPDEWTGILYSSAQKLSRVAGDPLATGTLTCTLKVNGWTHAGPGTVGATSSPLSVGVAVAPPVPVTFHAGIWDDVSVCAQVDVVGEGTYYWSDYANVGDWSTDPESVCDSKIAMYVYPPYLRRIYAAIDFVAGTVTDATLAADPVVCPALAALAPGSGPVVIDGTGDTYVEGELFWDCPPYRVT